MSIRELEELLLDMTLPNNMNEQISKIEEELKNHSHNGLTPLIKLENIIGLIKTVSVAPTHTPRNFFEQFIIYTSGATYRLYLYDVANNAWRYVALT